MDSLTQAVLGGAIGEAVLGREEGNKAVLWGVIAGTIPDLDILIYPFVDEAQALAIHRGLSHSFFFAAIASPLMGLVLQKIFPKSETTWKHWGLLFFLGFVTHALLDCFTNYGTQIFYPFTDYPVSFDSISIIDPLYTLPLLTGLCVAIFSRKKPFRGSKANRWGLILSTAYLAFTLVNKSYIHNQFDTALSEQSIETRRLFTNPALFNNILWYAVAETDSSFLIGTYSLLDEDTNIDFQETKKNHDFLAPYLRDAPVRRLLWFSKGYYTVTRNEDTLRVHDVRFPRSDFWLDTEGDYLFTFRLEKEGEEITGFKQRGLASSPTEEVWQRYRKRVFGDRDP